MTRGCAKRRPADATPQRPMRLALTFAAAMGLGAGSAALRAAPAPDVSGANGEPVASYADFDPGMLAGNSRAIDLARFEHGNPVLPGNYNVDVYLNRRWIDRMDVRFAAPSATASALPCVDAELLDRLQLKPAQSEASAQLDDPTACVAIGTLIPGATMDFTLGELRLDVSVPQAAFDHAARGSVSPDAWDPGITAARLNYRFNGYRTRRGRRSQTSAYLGLNAGVNVGLWQLRADGTLSWQSGNAGQPSMHHWQTLRAYLRRALPRWRATFTVGDSFTDGAVFDSVGLRGVQFKTADRMLPNSRRGYAPVVRGVAQTNAKVTVRQNGVQLYQSTVAPGPFVISDLYPTGYGGDLEVTVTEADGRERHFSVPYASVAQLLRPGITRWGVAAGQLRNNALLDAPAMAQATVQHGFANAFTGYAGVQGAEGYAAALVGAAFNTRLGALALDLTQAHASIPGYDNQSGQSLRLTYSKIIPATRTSLTVAAFRYSTRGFLSLSDAAIARDWAQRGLDPGDYLPPERALIDGVPDLSGLSDAQRAALAGRDYHAPFYRAGLLQHQRNRFTLTLNQRLGGDAGTLFVNGSATDYWNRAATDTQFRIGYNNRYHGISYSLSAQRTRDRFGGYDNRIHLSLSVRLGRAVHAPNFNLSLGHGGDGSNARAMLNGSLGEDNQFNYNASASHSSRGVGNAVSLGAGYRGAYGVYNASVGHGEGYSQASISASGGVLAHAGGVTFGQPLGDTVALVHVPGAAGARIGNAVGARIDGDGYAIVPYLSPWQRNTIRVDPQGLPLGVQLAATSAHVAPWAGAVVQVDFKAERGRALIARIRRADGTPVPFGAEVLSADGTIIGIVGQSGQALLRVAARAGRLSVRWRDEHGTAQTCAFAYTSPKSDKNASSYKQIQIACVVGRADALAQQEGEP